MVWLNERPEIHSEIGWFCPEGNVLGAEQVDIGKPY